MEYSESNLKSSEFSKREKPKGGYRTSYGTNRGLLNLHINRNKSPAYDRMRKQSAMEEYENSKTSN